MLYFIFLAISRIQFLELNPQHLFLLYYTMLHKNLDNVKLKMPSQSHIKKMSFCDLWLRIRRVQDFFWFVIFSQANLYLGQLNRKKKSWLAGRQLLKALMFQKTGYVQWQSLYVFFYSKEKLITNVNELAS
jgi:hypothetical protein